MLGTSASVRSSDKRTSTENISVWEFLKIEMAGLKRKLLVHSPQAAGTTTQATSTYEISARSIRPMKRVYDDISVPSGGDVPQETSAGVAAENGLGKAGNSALSPGAAGGAGGAAGHIRKKCPYLDTINRNVLDFDFEKVRNCPGIALSTFVFLAVRFSRCGVSIDFGVCWCID